MQQKVFIVGGDSMLGHSLGCLLVDRGHNVTVSSRRSEGANRLDLAVDVNSWMVPGVFDICFIFAAACSIDKCDNDPVGTRLINVDNTLRIAKKFIDAGCRVVFPSTSLVFDGGKKLPTIDEPCVPITEYGRQKADAEARLLRLGEMVQVIRYTKVVQSPMPLLAEWRKSLEAGISVSPFSDMSFSPVPLDFAVKVTLDIALTGGSGVWHVSGSEDVSYAEAARMIAKDLNVDASLVRPVSARLCRKDTEGIPANTALDISRIRAELNVIPPLVAQTVLKASHG